MFLLLIHDNALQKKSLASNYNMVKILEEFDMEKMTLLKCIETH